MKSYISFLLLRGAPFILIGIGRKFDVLTAGQFGYLLLGWILLYVPIVNGLRLLENGKIEKSQFLYCFIPFWTWRYRGFLNFNEKD
jgi:hypothetical protein